MVSMSQPTLFPTVNAWASSSDGEILRYLERARVGRGKETTSFLISMVGIL